MLNRRRSWIGLCLLIITGLTAPTWAQNQEPKSLWADYNHYVLIARPDLAHAAGERLLGSVDDSQLLDIVEGSREYQNYEQTLNRAAKVEQLKPITDEFVRRIQEARIARSRESKRITDDIQKLSRGDRANRNAIERLRAAGPYAAPALLNTLLEDSQKPLHPYVLDAMIAIGRPIVAPLSAALDRLEPVQQGQIARVLAEIGYPRALPVLKKVMENEKTDPAAKLLVTSAYEQLGASVGLQGNYKAADLYLQLAENLFSAATTHPGEMAGLDTANNKGLIWSYTPTTGLTYVAVPTEIFGDVESMSASMTALKLDPSMDYALSSWLMANLRRENNLPKGQTDPSYPADLLPPKFYLEMAGPLRQHDVLARALAISDPALALDAISALSATAGTDALVNRKGTAQPLLSALSSPDRRVRYEAAFALTNARPKSAFPGSNRVVPVLAQAVRQSDTRYAAVLGKDTQSANNMKDALGRAGFQTLGNTSLREIQDLMLNEPGVDLLVTNLDSEAIKELVRQTAGDYKLSAVPILVLTTLGQQNQLNAQYGTKSRIHSALWVDDISALQTAIDHIVTKAAGDPVEAEEAMSYATRSLNLLSEVSLSANNVFDVLDAQAVLIKALADQRSSIVQLAAQVLSQVNTPDAQQAIADAAMDTSRTTDARVGLLNSLSQSATSYGNHLNENSLAALLELVKTSRGELAIAAGRAHGALTLPTSNVVQLLVNSPAK